jgi:hypothetical protein
MSTPPNALLIHHPKNGGNVVYCICYVYANAMLWNIYKLCQRATWNDGTPKDMGRSTNRPRFG